MIEDLAEKLYLSTPEFSPQLEYDNLDRPRIVIPWMNIKGPVRNKYLNYARILING